MSLKMELNKLLNWYHPEIDAFCYQSVLWKEGFIIPKEFEEGTIADFFEKQAGIDLHFYHPQNLLYKVFTQLPEFNQKMTSFLVLEGDVFELIAYNQHTQEVREIGVNLLIASKDIKKQPIKSFFSSPGDRYFLYLKSQSTRKKMVEYLESLDLQALVGTLVKVISLKNHEDLESTDRDKLFIQPYAENWNIWHLKSLLLIREFIVYFPKKISNKILYKKTFAKLSYENHIYKNLRKLKYLQSQFK